MITTRLRRDGSSRSLVPWLGTFILAASYLACSSETTGDGFGESLDGPAISRTTTMIELADVSGDGAIDVCMRDGGGESEEQQHDRDRE